MIYRVGKAGEPKISERCGAVLDADQEVVVALNKAVTFAGAPDRLSGVLPAELVVEPEGSGIIRDDRDQQIADFTGGVVEALARKDRDDENRELGEMEFFPDFSSAWFLTENVSSLEEFVIEAFRFDGEGRARGMVDEPFGGGTQKKAL